MKVPLSHNILSSMMKRLSADAGLSIVYTNHCVRATSITNMKLSGVDDRRIRIVSGNRNAQSLSAYDRPSTKDACAMADAIDLKPVCSPANGSAAVSSLSNQAASSASAGSELCPVNHGALVPYFNAASATFTNTSIAFNIRHERAEKAKQVLKRKCSA